MEKALFYLSMYKSIDIFFIKMYNSKKLISTPKKNSTGGITMEQSRMDADRIKTLRQRMQLTQEDFAHLIGVTFSTVNRWENGKSSPSKLARAQFEMFCRKMKT